MRTIFEGPVRVDYSQATIESDPDTIPDLTYAMGGQANGLCGAAVPGVLWLMTGPQFGQVWFTVEVHDTAPPVGDPWEEVVEVSFTPATAAVYLNGWGGGSSDRLDLGPGDWRVRYCLSEMDEAHRRMPAPYGEPPLDRYLLQVWPAPPGADRVVRQTSEAARTWHARAAETAPPPPPPTEEEIRAAERAEQRRREVAREARVRRTWGGRAPSDRLRDVGGNVLGLAKLDRDLLDELASADAGTQRAVAVWAARRACEVGGIASLDWVAPALDALEQGDPLPPPFDDLGAAIERVLGGPVGRTQLEIRRLRPGEAPRRVAPEVTAVSAVHQAGQEDPLRAAIDTVFAASTAWRPDEPALFTEVRERLIDR